MMYTLSHAMYKYEHGLSAAEQRAADVNAGEVAAALRNLRLQFGRAFRVRPRVRAFRRAGDAVIASARTLPGIR